MAAGSLKDLQATDPSSRWMIANEAIVAESSAPNEYSLYNPALARLESGRLLIAFERSKRGAWSVTTFMTSDDQGQSWQKRGETSIKHGRFITPSGNQVYYIGHRGDLLVAASSDGGTTWGEPHKLTKGEQWHGTAANVWYAKGNVYLVMEKRVGRQIKGWHPGELAPILLRAPATADLTRRASWTFASELVFADLIKGYRSNDPDLNYFGVPFFPQTYPTQNRLASKRSMSPMGWLEANVVQIEDPNHLWFDPKMQTFHLFMRAHTGGTGYAALAKATENKDGTITTSMVQAPSGKTLLFLPWPGGQMRFHVLYDPPSKLYWMVGSQATDSMTHPQALPKNRYGLPNNERHRLVLHFSKNMVDWCFAGLVAEGNSPGEGRHYASMIMDGDDLLVLARSGNERAQNAHDGNLITLHRIPNFRNLIY